MPAVSGCSERIPLPPPNLGFPRSAPELAIHTVGIAHCRAIIGTESTLSLLPPKLQLMGIRELGTTRVAEALLLAGTILGDVDRHPRGPGCVPTHLWAALWVASLIFLPRRKTTLTLLIKQQQTNWQRCIYTLENKGYMLDLKQPPFTFSDLTGTTQCWAQHKTWGLWRQRCFR